MFEQLINVCYGISKAESKLETFKETGKLIYHLSQNALSTPVGFLGTACRMFQDFTQQTLQNGMYCVSF